MGKISAEDNFDSAGKIIVKKEIKIIFIIALLLTSVFVGASTVRAADMRTCELDITDNRIPIGGTITNETSRPCVAIANTRTAKAQDEEDLFYGISDINPNHEKYKNGECGLSSILKTLSKTRKDNYNWSKGCVIQTFARKEMEDPFISPKDLGRARVILFQAKGMPTSRGSTPGRMDPLQRDNESAPQLIKTPIEINTNNIHMATIIGGAIPLWQDDSARELARLESLCKEIARDRGLYEEYDGNLMGTDHMDMEAFRKRKLAEFMESCINEEETGWGTAFTMKAEVNYGCLGRECHNHPKTDPSYMDDPMSMNWEKHLILGDGSCTMDDGAYGLWCSTNYSAYGANTLLDVNENNWIGYHAKEEQLDEEGYKEPYYHVIKIKNDGVLRITGSHPVIFRNVKIKCEIEGGNCLEIADEAKVIFEDSAIEVKDQQKMPDTLIKTRGKNNIEYLGTNYFILKENGLKKVFDFEKTKVLSANDLEGLKFRLGASVKTIPLMSDDPVICSNATTVICTLPDEFHNKVLKINPAGKIIGDGYLPIDGKDYLLRQSLAMMTTSGRPIITEECSTRANVHNGSFDELTCKTSCDEGYFLSQNGISCELECGVDQHAEGSKCIYDDIVEDRECPGEAIYDGTGCICERSSREAVWNEENEIYECVRKRSESLDEVTNEESVDEIEDDDNDDDSENDSNGIVGELTDNFGDEMLGGENGITNFSDGDAGIVSGCSMVKTAETNVKAILPILLLLSILLIRRHSSKAFNFDDRG